MEMDEKVLTSTINLNRRHGIVSDKGSELMCCVFITVIKAGADKFPWLLQSHLMTLDWNMVQTSVL